jgi:hypothetical protein
MTSKTISTLVLSTLAATICAHAGQPIETGEPEIISHRINPHQAGAVTAGSTASVTKISYHGGAVMAEPNVYVIWYGNWNRGNGTDTPAGQQIVRDFLNAIGGSPYYAINTTYSTTSTIMNNKVTFSGEASDAYSQGTKLSDSGVKAAVNRAISNGSLPKDANGVYFVLTSSDVSEQSGFCNRYCGWHTAGSILSTDIKYSFVGNAARCLTSCAAQNTGPNGNAGVDGMISVIAHELEEAASDPDLNAWYDSKGAENADKCAWTFGQSQYQAANGAWANMGFDYLDSNTGAVLYHRDFLVQRNLLRRLNSNGTETDYCAISYDPVTKTFKQ